MEDGAQEAGLQLSSSRSSKDSIASKLQNATSLTVRELREITDDFSEERALGQGSYGKVYKGVHDNGEEIAVKLLYNNMRGIDDGQFQREFENLMRLEHHNIVRLVGYCYETQHKPMEYMGATIFVEEIYRALCFEYMQNGSLEKHLSDESHGLDWHTRYKIIKGTCEGLKYLHEGFKEPIYHLDLKPDNILLNENMIPKLADFGLSKFFSGAQTMITKRIIGTIGYLPPEYLFHCVVSKKLDIFSLGVVMTKIIAGPSGHTRSAEMPHREFIDQVQENWRNRLQATWSSPEPLEAHCHQVNICAQIALSCMEMDRHKRPSILDIMHKLNETEIVIDKNTKQVPSYVMLGVLKHPLSPMGEACSRMDLTAIHQILVLMHYRDDEGINELSFQEWLPEMREMLDARKRGDLAFRDKDFRFAIECYTQFVDVGTMVSITVYARRSLCHLMCDQPDPALRDALQAQCFYPDWPTAFYMQAVVLSKLNMQSDATNMLNKASQLEEKRLPLLKF